MAQEDLYIEFLKKLKADKTETEMSDFLSGVLKLSAAHLHTALYYFLDEADFQALDAISDEKKMEDELVSRFRKKSGVTPGEFILKLRDTLSKNYLFPELNSSTKVK